MARALQSISASGHDPLPSEQYCPRQKRSEKTEHREIPMTVRSTIRKTFPGQVAVFALASALSIPAMAQQSTSQPDQSQAPTAKSAPPPASNLNQPQQEGFWGKVNPFARKKWVNKRLDPIKGQLNELDEVNAKNASDIKDVDWPGAQSRNRQGCQEHGRPSQPWVANSQPEPQAQQANTVAGQASGKVPDQINGTRQRSIGQIQPRREYGFRSHFPPRILGVVCR